MTTNPRDAVAAAIRYTSWLGQDSNDRAESIIDALTEAGFVVVACPQVPHTFRGVALPEDGEV